jgi:hypothetical protein
MASESLNPFTKLACHSSFGWPMVWYWYPLSGEGAATATPIHLLHAMHAAHDTVAINNSRGQLFDLEDALTSQLTSHGSGRAAAAAALFPSQCQTHCLPHKKMDGLALRKARPPRGRPPVQLLSHFPGLGMLSSAGSWVPLQPALHGNIHQHHPPRISESFNQSCTEQN